MFHIKERRYIFADAVIKPDFITEGISSVDALLTFIKIVSENLTTVYRQNMTP